jgi:hypothetical protein
MKRFLILLFLFVSVSVYSQNSVEMDAYAVAYIEPLYGNGILYAADVNDYEMRLRSTQEVESLKAKVYFTFNNSGQAKIEFFISNGNLGKKLRLTFNNIKKEVSIPVTNGYEWVSVIEGEIQGKPSYSCMEIQNITTGDVNIKKLRINGSSNICDGIKFSRDQGRNAAGPVLWYDVKGNNIEYFYNEITVPVKEPHWTYFAVIGWHGIGGGYCGLQNQDPHRGNEGRPLIYSVWNSSGHSNADGNYKAVAFATGENVTHNRFDGEGEGFQSWNSKINWQINKTYCFLIYAHVVTKVKGSTGTATDTTFYSLYWKEKSEKQWRLHAIVTSPYNGGYIQTPYSFVENYVELSGHQLRKVRYSNQWAKHAEGEWHEVLSAGSSLHIQGPERSDKGIYVEGNGYYLWGGGYFPLHGNFGTMISRAPSNTPPPVTKEDEIFFNSHFHKVNHATPPKVNPDYTVENGVLVKYSGKGGNIEIPDDMDIKVIGKAFAGNNTITSINIPKGVEAIREKAFENCKNLKQITFPNTLKSIAGNAFWSCSGLTSVTIPKSVTNIERNAFIYCSKLTAINVNSSNPAYASKDGVVYDKNMTTLLQYPGGKKGHFTTPGAVSIIGWDAFYGCSGLESITFSNSTKDIVQGTFWDCTNLTSVTIPASVTHIGSYIFQHCVKLKNVEVRWQTPVHISDIFQGIDLKSATLTVPSGTKAAYQSAPVWKNFGAIKEK